MPDEKVVNIADKKPKEPVLTIAQLAALIDYNQQFCIDMGLALPLQQWSV